jgi:hypothetical protein
LAPKVKISTSPIGGFFFYFSIFGAAVVTLLTFDAFIAQLDVNDVNALALFFLGKFVGWELAGAAISDWWSVAIHEFKHKLVASLVGNRIKDLEIDHRKGHVTYEFTRTTAKYNALISLAPYWIPLFTIPSVALPYLFFGLKVPPIIHLSHVLIVGCAWGGDMRLNLQDISPHQTDFSRLGGGFTIGVVYVTLINLSVLGLLLCWVCGDILGMVEMGKATWKFLNGE